MSDPIEKMYVPDGPEEAGAGKGDRSREYTRILNEIVRGRSVAIPRAEYEAYRVAAEALIGDHYFEERWIDSCKACAAIAALRAAGIHETEGGEW